MKVCPKCGCKVFDRFVHWWCKDCASEFIEPPMDEWISVEDWLPEEDGYYLWYSINSETSVEYFYEGKIPFTELSHWMFLPEPPSKS